MGTAYRNGDEDEDDACSVNGEEAAAATEEDLKCLRGRLNAATDWNLFPAERIILLL